MSLYTLMALLFVTTGTKTLMKKLSFDGCKNDSWRVTDISLEPKGDKINVVADIGYEEKPTSKLHRIKVTLLGCDKDFKCTNHTNLVVGDVDCHGNDISQLDKEACDVAKILADWEQETGDLNRNQKEGEVKDACVHYETKLIDPNVVGMNA